MYVCIGETPGAHNLLPYLDGAPLRLCYAADDEAGVAWCYAQRWIEAGWAVYRDPDNPSEPARIERRGRVELRRRPDDDHPQFAHLAIGDPAAWQAACDAQIRPAPAGAVPDA